MPLSTCFTSSSGSRPSPVPRTAGLSDAEAEALDAINAARANPHAFGYDMGLDLSRVAAAGPLSVDPRLIAAAREHAQWMADGGSFEHTGPDGTPGAGIAGCGFWARSWGQSMAAGYGTGLAAVRAMVLDRGVRDLGHRRHLLGIGRPFREQGLVGIGHADGGAHGSYWVITTAQPSLSDVAPRPVSAPERRTAGPIVRKIVRRPLTAGETNLIEFGAAHGTDPDRVAARIVSAEEHVDAAGGPDRWLDRLYATAGRRPFGPAADAAAYQMSIGDLAAAAHTALTDARTGGGKPLAGPRRKAKR